MSKYHNDQPIQGDSNDPDLLNRLDFANHLAEALLLSHNDDCLTVSLEGEWGYGKTSVINLVKNSLIAKKSSPIIVEYNPWLAGNPDSLIQDFLLQFSSQLSIKDSSEDALRVSKELIAYSSLFGVAKLIPGAEPWASIVEKVFSKFGNTTKKIADLKKLDILGKKKNVITAIEKIYTPIIVIIDDIDRLTPSETFQILRLVKAVADFPGTSFLLAFDPSYLASVLEKNNIDNPSEYINKIIQLRVPLPVVSDRGMNKMADIELESIGYRKLIENFKSDKERLSWVYHKYFKHLIKNPRELKRFFNHLRFIIGQIEGQVCFSDLFSLSIISTKANSIYDHIKKSPESYVGRRFSNDGLTIDKPDDVVKSLQDERNKLLEKFSESDRQLIDGLLGEIFPLLNSGKFPIYGASDTDAAGRVSTPQRLHIALHYKTPIGYVSDQDILNFISGETERNKFMDSILADDADERFFEMMTSYSMACQENSFDVITAIYDAYLGSDKFKKYLEGNYGFSSNDPYNQMNWLTNKIISESENKFDLIKKLVGRQISAPLAADVLHKARGQITGELHGEPWVTNEQLAELEELYQNASLSVLDNKSFVDSNLESHIFYELKKSSKDKARKFLSDELNKDNGVIRVSQILANYGSDSSNGPFFQVNKETLSEVINLEELREAARKVNIQTLPIHLQAVIQGIIDGGKYYLRDGTKGDRE